MSLYTFVMDYKGGTYISQVDETKSLKESARKWARQLNPSEIYGFGEKTKTILLEQFEDEKITPISNLQNLWCLSFLVRNNLALVTIIKTVKDEAIQNPKSEIQN